MNEKLTEKLKKIDFIKGQNLFSVDDAPQNPYIRISLLDTKNCFQKCLMCIIGVFLKIQDHHLLKHLFLIFLINSSYQKTLEKR